MKNIYTAMATRVSSLIVLALILTAGITDAQTFGRVEVTKSNVKSYYYFVEPGAPTIRTHVIGAANYPGLYEVTEGTNVKQLLALAGGPELESRRYERSQRIYVRLHRGEKPATEPFFESELEDALRNQKNLPVLEDGDVLTIEVVERRTFEWRDVLTIVNVANTALLIIIAAQQIGIK